MRDDLPVIAIIAFTIVLTVRLWTTRHRRRHITIIVEDRTGGAKEPPPAEADGGSE